MNRGRRQQKGKNRNEAPKIRMRCNYSQSVVWGHENCPQFESKKEGETQQICQNCKHSF
jgi:hypothetical protein